LQSGMAILTGLAASIGFIHTVLGPDHYIPFIALAKSRGWSPLKTASVTALCGFGHVGSSIVLGFIGVAIGWAATRLQVFESIRGSIAAWILFAFGFAYLIWGIRQAVRNRPHSHVHEHTHTHGKTLTVWVLFLVFVFGPCEPLIPLLMYPAAEGGWSAVFIVSLVFSLVTIATMEGVVMAGYFGLALLPLKKLERYIHALAGATILLSASAILFLGL